MRPVSAPIGFVAALKTTFRHWPGRASSTACAGIPARVQASANGSIAEFHFNTEEQPCAGKTKTLLDLGFDQIEGVVVQNEFEEQVVLYGLQITAGDGNSYRIYFHQAFGT